MYTKYMAVFVSNEQTNMRNVLSTNYQLNGD